MPPLDAVRCVCCLALAAIACAPATQAAKFGIQHTVGVSAGACPAAMDSVERVRGAPYRRFRSDEENVTAGTQVFWHEWGYRLAASGGAARTDSATVVGFRWGEGVTGCDVRERRARVPGRGGLPWEGAGDVPAGA